MSLQTIIQHEQPDLEPRLQNDRGLLEQMLREGPDLPPGKASDIPKLRDDDLLRRGFEIIVSSVALILFAPLMLIIAIIIKLDTPGPALFFQKRSGKNGIPFTFVKFRTLYVDAKQRFPELYAYKYDSNEIKSMQFKVAADPRITPVGRWLRPTSMDELPNLFMILTGKMALVGPRPQILEMLPYYKGIMLERFSVRPGLTDSAHVAGRSNLSFYETTAMDVDYVRRRSWRLDLAILVKTVLVVIRRDGAF